MKIQAIKITNDKAFLATPESRNQKYRLTAAGLKLISTMEGNKHD